MAMEQRLLQEQLQPSAPEAHGLRRTQLIAAILAANPTTQESYLRQFDDHALQLYLQHLEVADAPRNAQSRWVRERYEPAVESHESAE